MEHEQSYVLQWSASDQNALVIRGSIQMGCTVRSQINQCLDSIASYNQESIAGWIMMINALFL